MARARVTHGAKNPSTAGRIARPHRTAEAEPAEGAGVVGGGTGIIQRARRGPSNTPDQPSPNGWTILTLSVASGMLVTGGVIPTEGSRPR